MRIDPFVVARLCTDLGGIARTAELAQLGVDPHSLRVAVRRGAVLRVREGVYAAPDVPADVVQAVAHGGAVSCVTLLRAEGIWLLDEGAGEDDSAGEGEGEQEGRVVHVSMPANARLRGHDGCTCVLHWSGSRRHEHGGRARIVDALAQALRCRGTEVFFIALESAMGKRLIDRRAVRELRGRIEHRHRWIVDFARWNADSGLESMLRFRLRALGLELVSQASIPGIGRVDFVLGDGIVIEVDGVPGHADLRKSRHKDLVRDAVASSYGLESLRFDYALVVYDWPLVEAAILAAVERLRRRTVAS